MMSKVHVIQLG